MSNWNILWKFGGVLLLAYVIVVGFGTPLQPGLVEASPDRLAPGQVTMELHAVGQPFAAEGASTEGHHLILRSGTDLIDTRLTEVTPHRVEAEVTIPEQMPSPALDAFLFTPASGTLFLGNAFFVEGAGTGPVADEFKAKAPEELAPDLGFSFPYQPNIMESIRNLMLHVPMWFTMFLLMGISFAQSIKTLRVGGDLDRDHRAVSAVKVGLWFGVLGLLTGSLWARFTWGAWWVDDPQLNGAFVTVMVYAGYLVLRSSVTDPKLRSRLSAVYNLFGFCLLVVLLMVLPRFTESLHPGKGGNPAFSSYDLDSALRAAFYPAVLGWMILGTWMYALQLRMERSRARIAEAQLMRSNMPLALLFVTPASTSSLEAVFTASGKMPVVVGVAVIIFLGLGLWWILAARELRRLSRQESPLNGTSPS